MLLNHLRRRLATSQHAAQRRKIVLQARRRAELEAEVASRIGMDQIVAVAVDDVNCAAGSGVLAHTREWTTEVDIYVHNPEWRLFFFFQAEDGIRDRCVTGVQTCALPI